MKNFFTKKGVVTAVKFLAIFTIGFFAAYYGLKISKIFVRSSPATLSPTPEVASKEIDFGSPPPKVNREGVYNTVFLGYGGAGHAGSMLTDSIIVLHVDTNNKTAVVISIPRDLWVPGGHKANAEASINGFQSMGGLIQNITGLPTDYFAAVNFSGFIKLIDNLGGITIDVPKSFDDYFYPITGMENDTCGKTEEEITALKAKYSNSQLEMQFTCRYEHLHFDKGPANLDGTTALKFVRSRHGDSDFGRSERQFAVLKGILAKLISLQALSKMDSTIDTLVSMVSTNLDIPTTKNIIRAVGDTGGYKLTEIHLTTENFLNEGKSAEGAYILVPKAGMYNFDEIKKYIASQTE